MRQNGEGAAGGSGMMDSFLRSFRAQWLAGPSTTVKNQKPARVASDIFA